MLIKICGLKDSFSVEKAAALGADLLGFVFAESSRKITPELCLDLIRNLPVSVRKVGVFVDERPGVINEIAEFCRLDYVQLHGNETPDDCKKIRRPVIKGFRIKNRESFAVLTEYKKSVEMFLLDTYVNGAFGGTGKIFDWSLAKEAAVNGKVILAGGLTAVNVKPAIEAVHPFGVDVSSGVETKGVKDPAKIEAFIRKVRG